MNAPVHAHAKGAIANNAEAGSSQDENLFAMMAGGPRGAADDGNLPPLANYVRIVLRRRWLLSGTVLAALIVGLLVTLLATPQYSATTQIEIARRTDRVVRTGGDERESGYPDLEFYQTQYGLLESRALAETVARTLKLQDNPKFFAQFNSRPTNGEAFGPSNLDSRIRSATGILLSRITIAPVRGSSLVNIRFTSPDPALSAQVINSWARSFIQANLERRFQSTAYAREFLEQRLEQLRKKLEESERLAVSYAANQGLVGVPTGDSSDKESSGSQRSLVAENLGLLNRALADATADRMRAESRLRSGSGRASAEALASPTLAALRARQAELSADYAKMMVQFEPGYPPAVALQSQISRIDSAIGREEARISQTIQSGYNESVSRERMLASQVNQLKQNFVDQQRRGIQYNIFQRDVDTNRELYSALLQQYKEIGVAGNVGTNNVSIVDLAQTPRAPSSPNMMLNLLVALILGSVVGVGLAFILETIDEKISDPAQVPTVLRSPLLGTVPKSDVDPAIEIVDPKSAITESYLTIQTSLQFLTSHGTPRTLAITSTRPGEGKSTTSLALARSLARARKRVLLVDGDMRSPSVHYLIRQKNLRGLSNYLSGNDDISALIHRDVDANFSVMTAGPTPPNAAALLNGDRLDELMAKLCEEFDHVVIDSPPVMGLADAPQIASRVEGLIYVIEAHRTPVSQIRMALQRLSAANVRIMGVVLSKFDANKSHYGYGYDYGYGYANRVKPE